MNIRVLDSLQTRQQWIEFCRREQPYCFVRQPDVLVDFQSNHLQLTLLNRQVRHGQQALKYSIGSRTSVAPAWQFIKACQFDLCRMIELLQQQDFDGNARDNAALGLIRNITIRQFFAKERSVISPAFLGPLTPLTSVPEFWDLHSCCRLLANRQFDDLRCDSRSHPSQGPNPRALLLALIEQPQHWQLQQRQDRLYIFKDQRHLYSLRPDIAPETTAAVGALGHQSTPSSAMELSP
ncbi:hypothetical protein [Motiliproteus sp.]|uniref:hypothetical protein n=1 Tax=Motiliproteus sp. TaxID=1898955 RepID=UPI003BAD4ABA